MILSKAALRQRNAAADNIKSFAKYFVGINLRPYQLEAANAIIKSVFNQDGKTFVIIFSRQSGKDELLAIIFLFLMLRFQEYGIDMVCAQPTFKPQTINAMERLKKRGANCGRRLSRTAGYIMRIKQAKVSYFSGEASASQVGATADRLLVMNEAQDIQIGVYDKRFSPMAASGNATKIFSGTSWTKNTLLAREKTAALKAEKLNGSRQVFIIDCKEVEKANTHYGKHVKAEIEKLGRQHPFIKTQYFCEELDAEGGLFNAGHRALMKGDRLPHTSPQPGTTYAFIVDVAGQDETSMNLDAVGTVNPGRDQLTLDIVSIDLSQLDTLQAPVYRVEARYEWTGENHISVFGKINAMWSQWLPQYMVIDATGVGEGLWAMFDKSHPTRVLPVKFSQQTKSEIGYGFLAIINTGRFRDCCPSVAVDKQYEACTSEILIGPSKTMRWSVPDGTRDADGMLIHDDHVVTDAMVSILDKLKWVVSSPTLIVQARDVLDDMRGRF